MLLHGKVLGGWSGDGFRVSCVRDRECDDFGVLVRGADSDRHTMGILFFLEMHRKVYRGLQEPEWSI